LDVDNTFASADLNQITDGMNLENPDDVYNLLDANIIRITPEMKAKILEGGLQAFAKGGAVTNGIEALPMQPVYPEEYRGLGSL